MFCIVFANVWARCANVAVASHFRFSVEGKAFYGLPASLVLFIFCLDSFRLRLLCYLSYRELSQRGLNGGSIIVGMALSRKHITH